MPSREALQKYGNPARVVKAFRPSDLARNFNALIPKYNSSGLKREEKHKLIPPFAVAQVTADSRSLPPTPVSPLFAENVKDNRCPRCDLGVKFSSPVGVEECTLHLNANLTAWMQTAGEALARLTGRDEFRKDKGQTLMELVRLFLLTPPAVDTLKFDTREGRVARGKPFRADWAESVETPTAETPTAVQPVEPNVSQVSETETTQPVSQPAAPAAAEAGTPPAIEVQPFDPLEQIYVDPPDGDDLYGGSDGELYREGD